MKEMVCRLKVLAKNRCTMNTYGMTCEVDSHSLRFSCSVDLEN